MIESSNQANKWNKKEDARGLGQLRPGVLKEWNEQNPIQRYNPDNLFDANINSAVSNWYMNERIPYYMKAYNIPDTLENRIIGYNAGPGKLKEFHQGRYELKQVTKDYIIKYYMGGDVRAGQLKLKELGFDPGPIDGMIGPKTRAAWEAFQKSTVSASVIQRKHGIQNLKK